MRNRKIAYGISIFTIIFLNIILNSINIVYLKVFLFPIVKIIQMYFNVDLHYVENWGYIDGSNVFVIGKSCAGIGFFSFLFGMFVPELLKQKNKLISITLFILATYFITLISNFIRISSSLFFLNLNFQRERFLFVHSAIGIVTYLTSLIISFYFISKLLKKGEFKFQEN